MTRKEWMEKNLPAYIDGRSDGGVISCPRSYRELIRIDPSVLTKNLEYIFFYDPEKKSIRKIPRDSALEKKYPEIDFTIYWDEESMNKAKRGIVTDREYENQYILLTKGESK